MKMDAKYSCKVHSPKLAKIFKNDVFVGWLEKKTRRTGGLHSELISFWTGNIDGTDIHGSTTKSVIEKLNT